MNIFPVDPFLTRASYILGLIIICFFPFSLASSNPVATNSSSVFIGCKPGLNGTFTCLLDGLCIPGVFKCDGKAQCRDGSDEVFCSRCEGGDWFRCNSGHCISSHWVCDGDNDCMDFSDESGCDDQARGVDTSSCLSGTEFKCPDDGLCVPVSWTCDDHEDCRNGEDESPELCGQSIANITVNDDCSGILCGSLGVCVSNTSLCDGVQDCDDGKDEQEDICNLENCLTENGHFLCSDRSRCLNASLVCDSRSNCNDSSDEGDFCASSKSCSSTSCNHGCIMTSTGPTCFCNAGYISDSQNPSLCVDKDECQEFGSCDQDCHNTPGGFSCSCRAGYNITFDNSCVASNFQPAMLLFSTKTEIRAMNLSRDGDVSVYSVVSNLPHVVGVGFDSMERRVYWTDVKAGSETLLSTKLDGSEPRELVSTGLDMPEDLVVDEINRNVYLTDSVNKHIAVCSLRWKGCTVLIPDLDLPRAIAIHSTKQLILFSDWGSSSINMAELDGRNNNKFVSEGMGWPNGLAVDTIQDRVYWSDAKKSTIETIKLDGTDRHILNTNAKHPFSLALFENTIYWSDWTNKEVLSCNRFTGKDKTILVKEAGLEPMGLSIYHPLLSSSDLSSPCLNSPCSHICLPSSLSRGLTCRCPAMLMLSEDQSTCVPSVSISSLIVSSPTQMFTYHPKVLGTSQFLPLLSAQDESLSNIVSSNMDKSLFAVTWQTTEQTIVQFDWNTSTMNDLIMGRGLNVGSMTYDPLSSNLFWIDLHKSSVMALSLNTRAITEIVGDLINPSSILFIPEKNRLLVGTSGNIDIVKIGDETNRISVPIGTLKLNISSLSYSFDTDTIFIGDPVHRSIYSWKWNSNNIEVYQSEIGEVTSLVVIDGWLYWVEKINPTLFWSSVLDAKKISWTSLSGVSSPLAYLQLAASANGTLSNTTLNKSCLSTDCSHLCFNDDDGGSTCDCPYGMNVRGDQKTCQPDCPDLVFSCGDGQCVPNRWRCDGSPDCKNSNDERHCGEDHVVGCNTTTQATCQDGGCVSLGWWCDGDEDCHDGSDESDQCPDVKCGGDKFSCSSGNHCVLNLWKCDGDKDCTDGSDEVSCHVQCQDDQFSCKDGLKCLPHSWVCDNTPDCHDVSDEVDCPLGRSTSGCAKRHFSCGNSNCISMNLLCNSDDDCGDGSDEQESVCHSRGSYNEPALDLIDCDDGFRCGAECLPLLVRCNGTWECPDESDEIGCNLCSEDTFRCLGEDRCIPTQWVCDASNDCSDGSDETDCSTTDTKSDQDCNPGEYQCLSGECLHLNLTCNGRPDCLDGSDEGADNCDTACINSGGCDQDCIPTPGGPVCKCWQGYRVTSLPSQHYTCADYDECSDIRSCSQHCTNTKGHYKCTCEEGYVIESDNRQCRAGGDTPASLMFAVHNNINSAAIGTDIGYSIDQKLSSHATPIRSFTFSEISRELLWSSPALGIVGKINIDNGTNNEVWLSGISRPEMIALDWITGNLYYSRQNDTAITVCSQNGEGIKRSAGDEKAKCVEVVKVPAVDSVTQLALDPKAGRMFVAGYSRHQGHFPSGAIYQFTMNGGPVEGDVIGSKTGIPSGLALDPLTSRVYWSDLTNRDISVCSYSGSDCSIVAISSQLHPAHIVFFQGSLFWTTGIFGTLHSHNIVTGQTSLRSELRLPPFSHSLLFQHPSLQTSNVVNPCLTLDCPTICLLSGPGISTCSCSGDCPDVVSDSTSVLLAKQMSDDDGEVHVEVKPVETGGSGSNKVIVLGVVFMVILLLIGIIAFFLIKCRNQKKDSEVEFRFSNMTSDEERREDSNSWISAKDDLPGISQVQNTKSGTPIGFVNPGFDSPASNALWEGRSTHPSIDRIPTMSWADSPVVSASPGNVGSVPEIKPLDTDSGFQLYSAASSMMSLDEEQHSSVDFHKDKTRLLED